MKIGYNQVCINPTFSCLPVGFLTQTEPLNKVRGDLYARCLRMEDENREVILITFDSLGISQDVQERMEELMEAKGLEMLPGQKIFSANQDK